MGAADLTGREAGAVSRTGGGFARAEAGAAFDIGVGGGRPVAWEEGVEELEDGKAMLHFLHHCLSSKSLLAG